MIQHEKKIITTMCTKKTILSLPNFTQITIKFQWCSVLGQLSVSQLLFKVVVAAGAIAW